MTEGSASAAGVREGDILAGKYRVERVLGIGGMGVVVAAHHLQLDEKVALKFLLPDALGDVDAVARFAREARAAVKIKSEHVARVTDVGTLDNGAPYMVMEYLEGGDLAAWIKQRGALPIEQAVEFVLQACVAVADAHALGIIHRDLKPANLFCIRRSDGQLVIKVLDFGISKMSDRSAAGSGTMTADGMAFTKTSALMGSPLYMSPEQMKSSRSVDARTDIWALGVIVFELVTGRAPFVAETVTELAIKIATEPTPSLGTFRPEAPRALDAIVGKCLEKDPRKRYRNVAELALALLPFAPKRGKSSVERISGIVQAAGLSTSALNVPPSSEVDATRASSGTLPALGRTTAGSPGRRKAIVGVASVTVFVSVAILGSLVAFKQGPLNKDDGQTAAAPPGRPSAEPALPPAPPIDAPGAVEPGPAALLPTPAPSPSGGVAAPGAAVLTNKKAPVGRPAPAAPPVATATPTPIPRASAAPAPGAAKCDPPYYFDAKGNRIFIKECL